MTPKLLVKFTPKRLPERKYVTLIVSLRKAYGAVILADSQETVKDRHGNEFKYRVLKSELENVKGFKYVIAGGGDGDSIDGLSEQFKRALAKSRCDSLDDFRDLFQRLLKGELKFLRAQDGGAELHLIVTAAKDRKWEIWRNTRHILIPTLANTPTLAGFEMELYQHMARALFAHSGSTAQTVLVGLRVLDLARQTSTCVDAPFSGVLVTSDGLFKLNGDTLAELTQSLTQFGVSLDQLLLSCADTSIPPEDFAAQLETFKENALHLRRDYLEAVAEKDMAAGGIGMIPLFPAGTMISSYVETATGKVVTTVEDDPAFRRALKEWVAKEREENSAE